LSRNALNEVTFEDGITVIGSNTLYGAKNVTSIVLPDSVVEIHKSAFEGMKNLSELVIPDSVRSISDYAIKNCNSITKVYIGKSVEKMGKECFNKQVFYDSDGSTKLSVDAENLRGYLYEGESPHKLVREYPAISDCDGGRAQFSDERSDMEGRLPDLTPATRSGPGMPSAPGSGRLRCGREGSRTCGGWDPTAAG
jgi:hypothetical protein